MTKEDVENKGMILDLAMKFVRFTGEATDLIKIIQISTILEYYIKGDPELHNLLKNYK